ncbi:hypothetical protein J2T23_002708 [Pseudarthrobacter niigatensis]|uniref:Uncharacterized protein n=1 Tax=Pseudarthrobacter niigatensis TaxID=369935 RepID=A0AAJ1STY3_9MICC|nr:hypothetical protein [Pseudarthrobacter niigatensis]MDQ0264648.1 hypothetical protein [Pseudarthrobacter niigatensis]
MIGVDVARVIRVATGRRWGRWSVGPPGLDEFVSGPDGCS